MPIERAVILPAEAALEVGVGSTFHHDDEHSMLPHLDHSELAHDDSKWSSEDDNSSSEEEAQVTPASRPSANVYSAYSRLQQRTQ